jgi:hypothetical protein
MHLRNETELPADGKKKLTLAADYSNSDYFYSGRLRRFKTGTAQMVVPDYPGHHTGRLYRLFPQQ